VAQYGEEAYCALRFGDTMSHQLIIEPLTRAAFAPYGDVIETAGAELRMINEGTTERFHALATADVGTDGTTILSLFRANCRTYPFTVRMLERHPLGSQAFYPLTDHEWLVVVGDGAVRPDPATIRCFRATGQQGVNYARNTWHHPVLVLQPVQDFLVMDRQGPGNNLEECWFEADHYLSVVV
jgi:ureidoglycolate lyase